MRRVRRTAVPDVATNPHPDPRPAFSADGGDGDEVSDLVREVVGEADVEEWGGRVVESWREGVKGLGLVKME